MVIFLCVAGSCGGGTASANRISGGRRQFEAAMSVFSLKRSGAVCGGGGGGGMRVGGMRCGTYPVCEKNSSW